MTAKRPEKKKTKSGRESLKPFLEKLDAATAKLDIYQPDKSLKDEVSIRNLRRRRGRTTVEDKIGMMTLTEVDGVLQWEEGAGVSSLAGRRARRGFGATVTGDIVAQFKFEKLAPSDVGKFLETLDRKLTPTYGLRRWHNDKLTAIERPTGQKRVLLFIHGTFSNNDNLIGEINSTSEGKALLGRAVNHYDEVLTFDHPTLAVSPVLNALDVARLFADCPADVDVICHSRGGLVTRWWLEGFGASARQGNRRAVMVGVPMGGTSLAAPPRLRAALNLITNFGRVLTGVTGMASAAVPMLSVASGLMKVVTSITSFSAKTPLVDAAVAMIPGLAGQSRVSNNAELLRLRQKNVTNRPDYFAICSDFEAKDEGWKFWRRFVKWKENLADLGTDIVFEGQNDLVVDTASMTELADELVVSEDNIENFGTTDTVHHTNYFRQSKTIRFIERKLQIP